MLLLATLNHRWRSGGLRYISSMGENEIVQLWPGKPVYNIYWQIRNAVVTKLGEVFFMRVWRKKVNAQEPAKRAHLTSDCQQSWEAGRIAYCNPGNCPHDSRLANASIKVMGKWCGRDKARTVAAR